ncbi:hypothetical protein CFP56_033394 [Quercus suber]|uniref:Uncharacterized protein n=1 Tax=Quercus suber TaxID=58331 RepID=A0AAW0LQZ2_QUESU
MLQGCTGLLRMLIIDSCGSMISLIPILKLLTSLEVLAIENCEKLDLIEGEDNQEEFPTSLRALSFSGLPQLVVLPEWIKRFCTVRKVVTIFDGLKVVID